MTRICGPHPTPNTAKVTVFTYVCPLCDGKGRWQDGDRCMECVGFGLIAQRAKGFKVSEHTPAPTPPAVMGQPCGDCAFRPGSPEQDSSTRLGPESPFYCHHGMFRVDDGYAPTAITEDGVPVGAMVCAGWWALATGRPLPKRAYRDPGERAGRRTATAVTEPGTAVKSPFALGAVAARARLRERLGGRRTIDTKREGA